MYSVKLAKMQQQMDWLLCGFIFATFVIGINYKALHIGGYGLLVPSNNVTWIGACAILCVGFVKIAVLNRIIISKTLIAYLVFIAMLLLPLTYTSHDIRNSGIMSIAAIFASLSLLFIISQNRTTTFKSRVLYILYLSTLIQSAWGLLQYYFIFENGLLFLSADVGIPVGTFGQRNVFSSYLGFGSLLAIYFLFNAKHKSLGLLIFTFFVVTINSHLTMLAEAKTGRVVPIIALAIYLLYYSYRFKRRLLCASLLAACLLASFTPKHWFDVRPNADASSDTAHLGIKSIGVRPIMYKVGVEMVLDKPINGYGMENIAYEFMNRAAKYQQLTSMGVTDHIHNEPLQWMMQLGILSGLAFIYIFVFWCVGLFKGWLDPSILFMALPFIGHSLLEFPFYQSASHLLAFSIILGLAINKPTIKIKFPSPLSGIILPLAGFLSYKTIVFMLLSLSSLNALVTYRAGNESDVSILYSVEPTSTFEMFFEHEKYEWLFKEAIQTGSISQQTTFDFINFLENARKRSPQSLFYIQLGELYTLAGQNAKAAAIMQEAAFLFPTDEKVIAYFQKNQ